MNESDATRDTAEQGDIDVSRQETSPDLGVTLAPGDSSGDLAGSDEVDVLNVADDAAEAVEVDVEEVAGLDDVDDLNVADEAGEIAEVGVESDADLAESAVERLDDHVETLDPDDPCSAAHEEVTAIKAEVDEAMLTLARSQLDVRKLRRKVGRLELELSENERDLQEIQNAQQSLEDWVRARRGSFAWRLSDSLAHERQKASSEKSRAESAIIGGRKKALGLLLTVEKPHKLWPRIGGQLVTLVALVIAFQYLRVLNPFVWTRFIPTPWPMIGFASLIFLGVAIGTWLAYERSYAAGVLYERWEQRKDEGVRGLDSGQHALALIDFARSILVPIPLLIAAGFAIMFVRDLLPTVVVGYFPQTWVMWAILAGVYLAMFFGAWMSYYRFLSRFKRQLREVLYESNRQKRAFLHASTEELRLGAMHSLVPDYLEMLGIPINSPWEVDLSRVREGEMRPDGSLLPASVGLAEATGGDSKQWNLMEMKSRGLLYRPGWITQAFRNVLEQIAEHEGMNPRLLTLDTVAADPGDSRRGQRRLVAEAASRPDVLSATGQTQLRILSEAIQRGVIREIKPLVDPLREDELENLDISTSRFKSDNPGQVPWNRFLQEALTDAAPFSMLAFSDKGIATQSFKVHASHALIPSDLVEAPHLRSVQIIEAEDGAHSTPLDLVIRIDHSDWLNPDRLTLFSGVHLPFEEGVAGQEDGEQDPPDETNTVFHPDE